MSAQIEYKTALYLRLSKDDEGAGESSSITTQRGILREFARTHDLPVVDEYVDDGYSGTNFDRPAFKRMMNDIEAGLVNCVITKDLSRLGRNSARTSDLLDEYFPAQGVRYISVIDGYDSLNLTSGVVMTAPLMMAMHEMYARDISCKIKTSFRAKMENGEYIGSFAPYGYKKDENNRNHLVPDRQVSHIVQEIFRLAAEGHAPGEIAKLLNGRGISTPAVYQQSSRAYQMADDTPGRREWTSSIVCKMLSNIVYLGHTAQGKTAKLSFKSKAARSRRRDEWVVVKNTHEAIISEEIFRLVRSRTVSRKSPPTKGFENIFSGIARCADCGRSMTTAPSRKKGSTYNLCCGGYKSGGAEKCSNHFIDYDLLYETVVQQLQGTLCLSDGHKHEIVSELVQEEQRRERQYVPGAAQSLAKMQQRMNEVSTLIKKLYEDHSFGRITSVVYDALTKDYEAELTSLERSIKELQKHQNSNNSSEESYGKFLTLLNETTKPGTLTKAFLRKFIDRIEVEQGYYAASEGGKRKKVQKIRIYYRFAEPNAAK